MKKSYFLISLIVISLLALSVVSASFWDFFKITGKAVDTTDTAICSDSDNPRGGYAKLEDEFKAGYVNVPDQTSYDRCDGQRNLLEKYCQGKIAKIKKISCNSGCEEVVSAIGGLDVKLGKCIKPPERCMDDDARESNPYFKQGIATQVFVLTKEFKDKCNDTQTLIEYSCVNNNDGTSSLFTEKVNCTKEFGTLCRQGMCGIPIPTSTATQSTPNTAATQQCADSDSTNPTNQNDASENNAGTTTVSNMKNGVAVSSAGYDDRCEDSKRVREYYCDGNKVKSKVKSCTDVCQDGRCIVRSDVCIDSDNGRTFGQQGTITTKQATVSDFCISEDILMEFGCADNKDGEGTLAGSSKTNERIAYDLKKCENGCSKGACCSQGGCTPVQVQNTAGSCTDTCASLGFECGTQTICGNSVNCGTCNSRQTCSNEGKCVIAQT